MAGFDGLPGSSSEAGGYIKYEMLGKGSYGAVYRGVHGQTGEVVALKVDYIMILRSLRGDNTEYRMQHGMFWLEIAGH